MNSDKLDFKTKINNFVNLFNEKSIEHIKSHLARFMCSLLAEREIRSKPRPKDIPKIQIYVFDKALDNFEKQASSDEKTKLIEYMDNMIRPSK